MNIYIVLNSYRSYEQKYDLENFRELYHRCVEMGFNVESAKSYLENQKGLFAVITLPKTDIENEVNQGKLEVYNDLMIGYGFISSFPHYRHLTLKTLMLNFNDLVIKQHDVLLKELYEYEREVYKKILH